MSADEEAEVDRIILGRMIGEDGSAAMGISSMAFAHNRPVRQAI